MRTSKPWQESLPFDETYAWENFIEIVKELHQAESVVFYGFGKKLKFQKIYGGRVRILSQSLNEPEEIDLNNQRRFEKVFMSTILKDSNRHFHIYERGATKNKDWRKQVYRCIDPDCSHYTQAQFIIGKRARCHGCKNEIIIEKDQVKNAAIVGICCSKSKKAKIFRETATKVEEAGIFDKLFEDTGFDPEGIIEALKGENHEAEHIGSSEDLRERAKTS